MKKFGNYILGQLKYFFVNPFWITFSVLVILAVSFIADGLIWYLYWGKYREIINIIPIGFSSSVLILNLFLANITFPKEKLISYILLSTGLMIQLFILFFLLISVQTLTY